MQKKLFEVGVFVFIPKLALKEKYYYRGTVVNHPSKQEDLCDQRFFWDPFFCGS